MANDQDFKQRITYPTPNTQEDSIDSKEVENIARNINSMIDDYSSYAIPSKQYYSKNFIDKVIEYLKSNHLTTPKLIFNLIRKSDNQLILYYTSDISNMATLYLNYDFASKDDALACKKQLEQIKAQYEHINSGDIPLVNAIERALSDVENQLNKFDDLNRKSLIHNKDLAKKNMSFANQFLEQFKNKFIPFELEIKTSENKIIDSTEKEAPNITVDIINSPVGLKKESVNYEYSKHDDLVTIDFDITTLDDNDNKKVAFIYLRLTSSGEIVFQHTIYNSDNLKFQHYKYTKKYTTIPYESFAFKKGPDTEFEILTITQVDNNVVGVQYDSKSSNNSISNDYSHFSTFLSSSLFAKPSFIGDYLNLPYRVQGMDGTLLKYQATETAFKKMVRFIL